MSGRESGEVATALARRHDIGVRDGLFCAHPLARRLLGAAAARAGWTDVPASAVRASIGLGTRAEDIDAFVAALAEILASEPGETPDRAGCATE